MADLKSMGISFKYDNDEKRRPGYKFADYEMKGVPVRIGIGAGIWQITRSNWCVATPSKSQWSK
jgi:prolyl-tRNA synthetase